MLDRIRRLLGGHSLAAQGVAHSFEERQLAAAALMVEAAAMDETFDAGERARIEQLIQDRFGLSADEAADLIAQAERAASASVELHGFTRAVKDGFDQTERSTPGATLLRAWSAGASTARHRVGPRSSNFVIEHRSATGAGDGLASVLRPSRHPRA